MLVRHHVECIVIGGCAAVLAAALDELHAAISVRAGERPSPSP